MTEPEVLRVRRPAVQFRDRSLEVWLWDRAHRCYHDDLGVGQVARVELARWRELYQSALRQLARTLTTSDFLAVADMVNGTMATGSSDAHLADDVEEWLGYVEEDTGKPHPRASVLPGRLRALGPVGCLALGDVVRTWRRRGEAADGAAFSAVLRDLGTAGQPGSEFAGRAAEEPGNVAIEASAGPQDAIPIGGRRNGGRGRAGRRG